MLRINHQKLFSTIMWITFWASISFAVSFEANRPMFPIKHDTDQFYVELVKIGMENRVIADSSGIILYAAPSISELTGYKQGELIGSKVTSLVPERYMPRHKNKMEAAVKRHDGKIVSTKCFLKRKDQTEVAVEIRTRVIDSNLGEVVLVTMVRLEKLVEAKL